MSDQPNNDDHWLEVSCTPVVGPSPMVMGFLQLCADRRFHRCIQNQFQIDAKIPKADEYWIHADAGGTATMVQRTEAPDYCYGKMKVRKMGWAAHGQSCGGFPDGTADSVIREELQKAMRKQRERYPEAEHYVYFATAGEGEKAEAVLYCMKYEKGST